MQNFNANTQAVLASLQATGFQSRLEKEGSSNKKHPLLGVAICYVDSAEQHVCPAYNDLEFDLNPIELREGKLVVTSRSIGKGDSLGHKWFETISKDFKGELFFVALEPVAEEYTPQPMVEPAEPAVAAKVEPAVAAAEPANGTAPAATNAA